MGYTNYHKHTEIPQAVWNKIVGDCKKLYANMPEHSESSGGYYSDAPLLLDGCVRERRKGSCEPVFTADEIWFNGTDPEWGTKEGHPELANETFTLFRRGSDGFCYCKTNRKPYDLMVQACLLVYRHYSPNTINLGSDGNEDEWQVTIDFVHNVLGYWTHPFNEPEDIPMSDEQKSKIQGAMLKIEEDIGFAIEE